MSILKETQFFTNIRQALNKKLWPKVIFQNYYGLLSATVLVCIKN